MYFARRCRTAVLPPSKRQKAQKPHSCAVFLILMCFIFFRAQNTFLLEKNSSLFFSFFYARSNRLFRQSHGTDFCLYRFIFAVKCAGFRFCAACAAPRGVFAERAWRVDAPHHSGNGNLGQKLSEKRQNPAGSVMNPAGFSFHYLYCSGLLSLRMTICSCGVKP